MSQTPSPAGASSRSSAPIDLRRVRELFAAPDRVIESNFLRREIASRMLERLALVNLTPRRVLDAGCGPGADFPALQRRFPDTHLIGLDASEQMLGPARGALPAAHSSVVRTLKKWMQSGGVREAACDFLCGNFAQMPLSGNAIDLVWSNLALHWHPRPDQVFAEWRRVLQVNGVLMFSCFGPDTFKQLRAAFESVDPAPHVLPFVDMHDFGDMLVNAGMSTPVMDMEIITVTYASVEKMMVDVRAWGGNPLATRRRSLFGKSAWSQVKLALESLRRPDGTIPLTYEIIYGHAFKPLPKLTSTGETIIRIDLRGPSGATSGRRNHP